MSINSTLVWLEFADNMVGPLPSTLITVPIGGIANVISIESLLAMKFTEPGGAGPETQVLR